jgi:hypothetical protein
MAGVAVRVADDRTAAQCRCRGYPADRPGRGQRSYGLLWWHGSFEPNPDSEIALTVAGLRHVSDASLLTETFLQVLKAAATALSQVKPDPHRAVPTTIGHEIVTALARQDQRMSAEIKDLPPLGLGLDVAKRRIRVLFEHEPFTVSFSRPSTASENWTMTVAPFLRRYKDIATVDDYLDRLIADYVPLEMPSAPISPHPLDVPYAAVPGRGLACRDWEQAVRES